MKKKWNALIAGRNGLDFWNYVIIVLDVLLIAVAMLTDKYLPLLIAFLLIVLFLFRALSRNLERRHKEDRFFSDASKAILREHKLNALRWKDRRTHVYKKCPACRRVLRVKRRKGPKEIHCPYCNTDFKIVIHIRGDADREGE
ncbi:MAG: hypothetical protein IJ230_05460 [Clostridia bacterium]|nr:hypothetical protein [Clostridia bacterium]